MDVARPPPSQCVELSDRPGTPPCAHRPCLRCRLRSHQRYLLSVDGDRASLSYSDVPPGALAPWTMERATAPQSTATTWQPNRLYVVGDSDVSSPEMKAIYDADQAERQAATIDGPTLGKADSVRREKARKLLDPGSLHTGQDFEEAAIRLPARQRSG